MRDSDLEATLDYPRNKFVQQFAVTPTQRIAPKEVLLTMRQNRAYCLYLRCRNLLTMKQNCAYCPYLLCRDSNIMRADFIGLPNPPATHKLPVLATHLHVVFLAKATHLLATLF